MKLITRAKDCNIRTYRECRYSDNFETLIIEGEPTAEELFEAWQKIYVEYLDLSGVDIPELEKKNKIAEVDLSIKCCNLCFIALEQAVDSNLMEEIGLSFIPLLKSNGVSVQWNKDVADFKKQLKSAQISYKIKYSRLDELQQELKQIESGDFKPETESDFYRLMNNIETLMNIRISETEMNLARFAVLVKDYVQLISRQSPS